MKERRKIWLGLTALSLTVAAWAVFVLISAASVYVEFWVPGGMDAVSDESPIAISFGLAMVVALFLDVTGLIVAIVGLFSRNENRLFPIIAVVLSVGFVAIVASLFLLGVYFG